MGGISRRSRGNQLYAAMLGAAVGAFVTGLVLPLVLDPTEADRRGDRGVGDVEVSAGRPFGRPTDSGTAQTGGDTGGGTTAGGLPPTPGGAGTGGASAPAGGTAAAAAGPAAGGELRIGVLVPDTGAVSRIGLATTTPEQNEAWWRASFDIQNQRGGAGGRKLVPIVERFDALDSSYADHGRACEKLANDEKVFAVLAQSGYAGPPILCLAERYGLPTLLIDGETSEYYVRSRGLLFSKNQSTERTARNAATLTHRRGVLRDRTIGVVLTDIPTVARAYTHGLGPRLEELGYRVARVSRLSNDLSTTQSQIPVEVAQQRAAGVDLVFLVTDPVRVILWAQEADAQGFRPRYVAMDILVATSDFTVENVPESFDGVGVTVTQQGWDLVGPPPGPERDCKQALDAHSPEPVPEPGTAGYRNATVYCGMVQLLARGIDRAGPNLTAASLIAGFEAIGSFVASDVGPASFGRGKHDGADAARLLNADMRRRRWVPQGAFERVE